MKCIIEEDTEIDGERVTYHGDVLGEITVQGGPTKIVFTPDEGKIIADLDETWFKAGEVRDWVKATWLKHIAAQTREVRRLVGEQS